MRRYSLVAVSTAALLAIGAFAAETVVKNSAPFSFPLTVGTVTGKQAFAGHASFTAAYRTAGGMFLDLSWSFSSNRHAGTITLFSLRGTIIRSFPIKAASGFIRLNISESRLAKGIYFARLSSGPANKNLKIVIY
ncbi:MAG: T9SS type A sorting domain-containing protein [Chitinispirillaceae bacterium]|nr:T9SS type A sorting domain-containing protein [Chitinispirillaceae bacterium]